MQGTTTITTWGINYVHLLQFQRDFIPETELVHFYTFLRFCACSLLTPNLPGTKIPYPTPELLSFMVFYFTYLFIYLFIYI